MKELLGEELFNQVKEKIGDKEIFINDGTYIPKSKFDELNNDKKELKKQLEEVNKQLELKSGDDAENIKKELEDLKSKYETDTKTLNDKISMKEREYLINDLTRDIKFSSNGARKNFMEELASKDLKIEEGRMVGYDDFLNSYKENDPSAFKTEPEEGQNIDLGGTHNGEPEKDDSFERKVMGLPTK